MSKGSDAVKALLDETKARQAQIAERVSAAERTLVKRRHIKEAIDAEVRELEADLAALRRVPLQVVA